MATIKRTSGAARIRSGQFSLRSLLAGLAWLALILGICVQYQHAATRQRAMFDAFKGGATLPAAKVQSPRLTPAGPATPDAETASHTR